jgi:hypothetical protein
VPAKSPPWTRKQNRSRLAVGSGVLICLVCSPTWAEDASPDAGVAAEAGTGEVGPADEVAELKARVQSLEERLLELSKANDEVRKESSGNTQKLKTLAEAIQLSGFFDVTMSSYDNNPNIFELGSFEFDLKKEFNKYFQVGAALVFADQQAELAVGFIDFHLMGGLIPARGNVFLESGFHLQIGRFDIPFGNDWQYFASLDRTGIGAPLTTTVLMDGGYNDVGFRVLGNWAFINYAGYILRGAEKGVALGGRLALVPFNNPFTMKRMDSQPLDIGVGYLHDINQDGRIEQQTWAIDGEVRVEMLRLQSEVYWRRDHMLKTTHTGWHASLFSAFFEETHYHCGAYARYDETHLTGFDLDDRLRRLTLGIFAKPFEVTVFKFEYGEFLTENDDHHGRTFFGQLVIGFK